MTAQYHPFLATTKYQRTRGRLWVCVSNLWTWIYWHNALRKKSQRFWAGKQKRGVKYRGEKIARPALPRLYPSRRLSVALVLWPRQRWLVLRWQGPNGSHLTQPGNSPSAETTGQLSQDLAGVLRGAESFGGAALSFLSRQLRTEFRHQDRLSTQSLPPEGSSESGGLRTPLWRQKPYLSHLQGALDGGGDTAPHQHSPFSLQKHKDSWCFFFFCFKKLPAKLSECRRKEIAEDWEPGVLSALPWLCLGSNDPGNPVSLCTKLLSPVRLRSSRCHPRFSWTLTGLKKTMCVGML